jgi:hypothetical protein
MKSFWAPSLLVLAASVTLSCGSGNSNSGRQLQSITVVQVQNGSQFQFIATGTFSAPPPTYNYTLSTQPYVYNCDGSGLIQVVAFAPPNPDAPSSGSVSQVVQGVATFTCP